MTVNTPTIFDQISLRIIKQQELVIGPIAWEEARKIQGLHIIDQQSGEFEFDGDAKEILNRLVSQYSRLFGRVSAEVCREAVQDLLAEMPQDDVPTSLQ